MSGCALFCHKLKSSIFGLNIQITPRQISFQGQVAPENFCQNIVRNQKYSILSFVPLILYNQFKMFYIAFINLANERSGNALWMMVQPFIKDLARVMEGVLGNAHSFKPGLTHVMLTALMLAIIVSLERVRSAVVASKRGSTRLD